MPDDLKKAAELLQEASAILAKRLAGEGGPKRPTQARLLATAISHAQDARLALAASLDDGGGLTMADHQF